MKLSAGWSASTVCHLYIIDSEPINHPHSLEFIFLLGVKWPSARVACMTCSYLMQSNMPALHRAPLEVCISLYQTAENLGASILLAKLRSPSCACFTDTTNPAIDRTVMSAESPSSSSYVDGIPEDNKAI